MATAAHHIAPDLSHPSWPLRLNAYRDSPFLTDCLESILSDADRAKDGEVSTAVQYALDSGDLSDLDFIFNEANAAEGES